MGKSIIALMFLLTACAPARKGDSVTPTTPPLTRATCKVYDSCTYSGGLFPAPVFSCVEKLYIITDSVIPQSYFDGAPCLTTREDFHTEQSFCGPQGGPQFPCNVQVQGPGPKAIPEINL